MLASYRWLRRLLPALDLPPDAVAERLTALGLEVEGVTRFGDGLDPVLVAQVTAIEPHPSRSQLRLVTVDRGGTSQRVVCGAPNVPDPGGLVVLAPLGTHLPAKGMTIEPRPIGGIVSEGMLCSESELGIGEGSGGILVLDPGSAKPGQRFIDAFPSASDTIFSLGVTPNRPDALGHVGIARDLAAVLDLPFAPPAPDAPSALADADASSLVRVVVDDTERCPHYGAAVVEGVTIGPSPMWLQHLLTSLGVRPISNVVDLTNLILLEEGHPMHAFDLDRVRGGEIRVRRARVGETLRTLDGGDHALVEDDLVIADAEGATGLAGVMGGGDSEIHDGTTRVLLECAWFDPRSVRRSSRRHALHTEASHRFERGVDRDGVARVLARATALLVQLAGGRAARGAVHAKAGDFVPTKITLRSARVDALLGSPVPWSEALAVLGRLGARVTSDDGQRAVIEAPSHRPDLGNETDLVEEIARTRGLDRIEAKLPAIVPGRQRRESAAARMRAAAATLGLSEAVTYAFVSPADLAALGAPAAAVTLENPMSDERSVLRTSVLPGLLDAVKRARRHGEPSARLFTVGRTFHPAPAGSSLPEERRVMAVVLAGPRPTYLARAEDHDVLDAKGVAVELAERATRAVVSVATHADADRPAHHHPRGSGRLSIDGREVGTFGILHPDVVERLDLGGGAVVVELSIDALETIGERVPKTRPVPRVPAVSRDVSLVVEESTPVAAIETLLREVGGELCETVELFDVFRGGSVPEGRRALAFHVVYRDPKAAQGAEGARTLTDAEVDQRHERLVTEARTRLGAELRTLAHTRERRGGAARRQSRAGESVAGGRCE